MWLVGNICFSKIFVYGRSKLPKSRLARVVLCTNMLNVLLLLLLPVSMHWVEKLRTLVASQKISHSALRDRQRHLLFEDSVAIAHSDRFDAIARTLLSAQRTRLSWASSFEKLSSSAGVERFATEIYPRKPLATAYGAVAREEFEFEAIPDSGMNSTAGVAKRRFIASSGVESESRTVRFYETVIALDMQLSNENVLLDVLNSLSNLSGLAADLTQCHLGKILREASYDEYSLIASCSLKVVELDV